MTIRLRTVFFITLGILCVWFLYLEASILRPFILAGIFAYIFNPVVNFFTHKVKLPRTLVILIIYAVLLTGIIYLSTLLTQRIITESSDITLYVNSIYKSARIQIEGLPDWIRPTAVDALISARRLTNGQTGSFAPLVPQAVERLIGFIIFLFSAFYFLKDGESFFRKFLSYVPSDYKIDVEVLFRKINSVLSGYLRGQIFLIFLMTIWTFIALAILGVRFSLLIAVFSGFAEIVPVIGPILAAALAVLVVMVTGHSNFGLQPIQAAFIVIAIYFVLRHVEDYFIIPQIMGKITKLPPFVIFFAVISGGHLWGILGLILAVPLPAVIRLFLEFSMDQINGRKHPHSVPGSE